MKRIKYTEDEIKEIIRDDVNKNYEGDIIKMKIWNIFGEKQIFVDMEEN